MEVDHDMMLCSLFCHSVIIINHPLVLTVHEVNLRTYDTPLFELFKEIHIMLYGKPRKPYKYTYIFRLSIADELRKIYLRVCLVRVAGIQCPTLIHNNVRDTVT